MDTVTFVSEQDQKMRHDPEMDLLQLHAKSTWQMMIYCMLLNRTQRKQVDKVCDELFIRWSGPCSMALAEYDNLVKVLQPLGLAGIRATRLIRFSQQYFISKRLFSGYESLLALEGIAGIGEYALDSFAIFSLGHINIRPRDKELIRYVEWLGADVRKGKKKLYVILAGDVISKSDGQLHRVSATQLVRLYNLDPDECILLESEQAWQRWIRGNDHSQWTILSTLYHGNYREVHRQLMAKRQAA